MKSIALRAVRGPVCVLVGSLVLAAAGAAAAQAGYAGGVTVYGHPHHGYHHLPNGDPELSRRVSYADLDLATDAGVAELRWRIGQTAQDLCARLGEDDELSQNTAVLPSCQAAARDSAYQQVQAAIDGARYAAAYRAPVYAPPVYAPAPVYSPPVYAAPAYADPCGCTVSYAPPAYVSPPVYVPAPAPVYAPAPAYVDPCACEATYTPPPQHWVRREHVEHAYVEPAYDRGYWGR